MKSLKKSIFYVLIITAAFSFEAQSAVSEVQGCNLKKGTSMDDVIALSDQMNQIQDGDGYIEKRFGQLIMQPIVEQAEKSEFDFYFLNFWGNYQIYGNDMSEWVDQGKGDKLMIRMGQILDCRTLNLFNTTVTREYPGD